MVRDGDGYVGVVYIKGEGPCEKTGQRIDYEYLIHHVSRLRVQVLAKKTLIRECKGRT